MNADRVADGLYALPPPQFTEARNAAADQARALGDIGAAARIKAMRRPTLGAWLANLLVREYPQETRSLLELAAALRAAQGALDGPELRELTARRRAVVTAMSRQAKAAAVRAGLAVGDGPLQDLEDHLQAVLVDQDLADAFATGRLVSTRGSGSRAPATAPGAGRAEPLRPPAPPAGPVRDTDAAQRAEAARRRAEAGSRAAQAQRAARKAQAEAATARRELERASAARLRIQRRIDQLSGRLEQAHDEERSAAGAERGARARVEASDRTAREAQGRARDAAAHLEHLERSEHLEPSQHRAA